MRILQICAFVFILCRVECLHAQDEHVAIVRNFSGEVKISRAGTNIVPTPGAQLKQGDILACTGSGSLGVVFVDGTTLALGPTSEIEIRGYRYEPEKGQYDFSVFLKKGSAIYTSGKLGKLAPESVKVSTPRAVIGVRGTRFLVKSG